MKHLRIIFAATLALLSLAACNKDNTKEVEEELGNYYSINGKKTEILTAGIYFPYKEEKDDLDSYGLCFTPTVEDLIDKPDEYLYLDIENNEVIYAAYQQTPKYNEVRDEIDCQCSILKDDESKSIDIQLTLTMPCDDEHENKIFNEATAFKLKYKGKLIEF